MIFAAKFRTRDMDAYLQADIYMYMILHSRKQWERYSSIRFVDATIAH